MTSDGGFIEDDGAQPSWLRRLWFRLLLLFRRIARLFGAGPPAERVTAPEPESFLFDRVPAGPPFTEVNHPILRQLRRRALGELFDWLDLDFVPGQLIERSDHSNDPVAAFSTFLRSAGCDPERVRRRDPEELAHLGDVIDLLMAFGSLTARLETAQRDALQLLLFSGDFERLRLAAERLFTLSAVLEAHETRRGSAPLAAYDALAGRVKAMLGRLLALSESEIATAQAEAERWLRLARRRTLLSDRVAEAFEALARAAATLSVQHRQRRDGLAERQHAIESALAIDPGLEPSEAEALLDELESLLGELQNLLRDVEEEAEAAESFQSDAATERLYHTEQEAALAFFGLPLDARPDANRIRAAWRRYMKDNHPDLTTDEAEKARREALCKEANLKRHILERAFAL